MAARRTHEAAMSRTIMTRTFATRLPERNEKHGTSSTRSVRIVALLRRAIEAGRIRSARPLSARKLTTSGTTQHTVKRLEQLDARSSGSTMQSHLCSLNL